MGPGLYRILGHSASRGPLRKAFNGFRRPEVTPGLHGHPLGLLAGSLLPVLLFAVVLHVGAVSGRASGHARRLLQPPIGERSVRTLTLVPAGWIMSRP